MQEIPPEIELPLERSRMERAFVNLIGNAHRGDARGRRGADLRRILESDAVLVEVRDNGPGIAPEIRTTAVPALRQRAASATASGWDSPCRGRPCSSTAAICGWIRLPAAAPGSCFRLPLASAIPSTGPDDAVLQGRRSHA